MQRPTGVTILAVLALLGGIFGLLGGVGAIVAASIIGSSGGLGTLGGAVTGLAVALGAFLLVVGLVDFAGACGFWTGKAWAW
jgi:hypothetical protein